MWAALQPLGDHSSGNRQRPHVSVAMCRVWTAACQGWDQCEGHLPRSPSERGPPPACSTPIEWPRSDGQEQDSMSDKDRGGKSHTRQRKTVQPPARKEGAHRPDQLQRRAGGATDTGSTWVGCVESVEQRDMAGTSKGTCSHAAQCRALGKKTRAAPGEKSRKSLSMGDHSTACCHPSPLW